MHRLTVVAALAFLTAGPSRASAQDSTKTMFLTGPCPSSDSLADVSDVVDQPDRAPALEPGLVFPPYPESLRRPGYRGQVVAGFVVERSGKVRSGTVVILSSTDSRLSRWACDAVPQIRLDPARLHGRPVAAQVSLPFLYRGPPAAPRDTSSPSAKPPGSPTT